MLRDEIPGCVANSSCIRGFRLKYKNVFWSTEIDRDLTFIRMVFYLCNTDGKASINIFMVSDMSYCGF